MAVAICAYALVCAFVLAGVVYGTWQLAFAGLDALLGGLLLVDFAGIRGRMLLFGSPHKGAQALGFAGLALAVWPPGRGAALITWEN